MLIIDINGKERTIKNDYKIITEKRSNDVGQLVHENIEGELVTSKEMSVVDVEEKFVEVIIIGNNREWVEWYPLERFGELNPEIDLVF